MFWTWRATVCSLTTSSAAIARFVRPTRPGGAPRARARSGRASPVFRATGQGIDAPDVGLGAERVESRPSGLELERSSVLVSQRPAGEADEEPNACALVRRVELLPDLPRSAERAQRSLRLSTGELDRPTNLRRDRAEHRAPVARVDLVELCARRGGFVDLRPAPGRPRRTREGAPRAAGARRSRRARGGARRRRLPRLLAPPAGAPGPAGVRGRSGSHRGTRLRPPRSRHEGGEARPADSTPAPSRSGSSPARIARAQEPLPRARPPRPVQLLDPGAVRETASGERDQLRLRLTPARERFVHSCARRGSNASSQDAITPQ